ncbi:triose-phosphate isomerase [Patescibacteria group bacterium]|nr:triose-phosphate isomerase [Patescibacteria group bacterium]
MKLIAANWKMNPASLKEAVRLAGSCDEKGVVIIPPFVFLSAVGDVLKKAELGAQNAFFEDDGAWTGEISFRQLKGLGVRYAVIGHSERRKLGESDGVIAEKVVVAFKSGFRVILCVGEHWETRKKGKRAAYNFVKKQLVADLAVLKDRRFKIKNLDLIVAYEPIWAIGTGRNDDPEDAAEMAGFIKEVLAADFAVLGGRVLYGGSVNARNASGFLTRPEIDGVLVGGASLRAGEFKRIIAAGK